MLWGRHTPVVPALRKLRQENHKFDTILGIELDRICPKRKKKKQASAGGNNYCLYHFVDQWGYPHTEYLAVGLLPTQLVLLMDVDWLIALFRPDTGSHLQCVKVIVFPTAPELQASNTFILANAIGGTWAFFWLSFVSLFWVRANMVTQIDKE